MNVTALSLALKGPETVNQTNKIYKSGPLQNEPSPLSSMPRSSLTTWKHKYVSLLSLFHFISRGKKEHVVLKIVSSALRSHGGCEEVKRISTIVNWREREKKFASLQNSVTTGPSSTELLIKRCFVFH